MSYLSPTQTRAPLAAAVGAELARLEGRLGQWADPDARQRLAGLSESAAARVLRTIGESRTPVKTLSGYIRHLADKEAMERNARGIPPAESAACSSGPSHGDESVSGPLQCSDDQYDVQSPYREEITLGLSNNAGSANQPRHIGPQDDEGSGREIAHVVPNLSAMAAQTPSGWVSLRNQNDTQINSTIRAMAALTPTKPPVQALPCMAGEIPSTIIPAMMPVPTQPSTVGQNEFGKTPAMMPVPTLPWMAGEDPEAWIGLLKRDCSHDPAMTPPVWNQIPVKISSPARAMAPSVMIQGDTPNTIPNNIHTPPSSVPTPIHARDISGRVQGIGVPSGSPHIPAWAGVSSPTIYCSTSNASREKASPQMEALDGMEFRKIFMIFAYLSGNRIEDELSVDYIRSLMRLPLVDFESQIWNAFGHKYIDVSDRAKPLLTQFRMFYKGAAVKGTVLVDRRLPPGTILVRPSMIKIKSDPELCGVHSISSLELMKMKTDPKLNGVQSVNSLEIVTTSNHPKRTSTSRYLIALLYYGGVKAEYFMELLHDAVEGAANARYSYNDALKLAFIYADMEDSMSARMILSGVPLEDAYLQSRLATMSQLERKGFKEGKLPIDDCFYLMGTTDPTGKLRPNEVCVILENGQYSGKVLVYKHPGLHFGDIHVFTSRYVEDIGDAVGHSRYALLFPTTGPRSSADEMANSDHDGDMFWVSINAQINVPSELIAKKYPHFMDRKQCYHSKSILGRIYDKAVKVQSENVGPIKISLDPRFKERDTSKCKPFWTRHYKEYCKDSGPLAEIQDKEEVDLKFSELYHKYKHILYHAAEFEQTPRDLKDVFDEACAIYQIVYESAVAAKKPGKCSFAWKVAGHALCHFLALQTEGDKVLVPLSVAKNLLVKGRKK
ncbi:hypothetical protein ACQ4PT_007013 [Festuca glaucescens]